MDKTEKTEKTKTASKHIKTLNLGAVKGQSKKTAGCGECQASCQSACKTSCTVANQKCENIEK